MVCLALLASLGHARGAVFNVRDYGATGRKSDDARPAIQQAIDACAAAGGGTVLLPGGEYTSGSLWLRSRVRFEVAAGATLFATTNEAAFATGGIPSKAALLNGDNVTSITITGAGTLDGQAEYEWRDDDVEHSFDHKDRMVELGKSIRRPFPLGFPKRTVFPHLLFLKDCREVSVAGLRFRRAPSWAITLAGCERARLDGLHVSSSLKEAVWADGIDLDGCKDVRIERCHIETGDDGIIFISTPVWGPARPCENITVSNCRLSSASAGIKFSEGNFAGVRNVTIRDCVLTNVNRGLVFYTVQGGDISDVSISNLTIHCNRFAWFWAGDGQPFHFRILRLSEWNRVPPDAKEPAPGTMRNITIRNVTAHGKGSSSVFGHAENWLDGIRFENVRLTLTADTNAPYDAATNGVNFARIRNLRLKDLSVEWRPPPPPAGRSALAFDQVQGLEVDGFTGRQARPEGDAPALSFARVTNAVVHRAVAEAGTGRFAGTNAECRDLRFEKNDLRRARDGFQPEGASPKDPVIFRDNRLPR